MTPAPLTAEERAEIVRSLVDLPIGPWRFAEQIGLPGHCDMAQVWSHVGRAIVAIEPTDDPAYATALAAFIAAAREAIPRYEAALAAMEAKCEALAAEGQAARDALFQLGEELAGRIICEAGIARSATARADALARECEALRRERDDAQTFVQNEVDQAPEPLKRLGRYLADVLDEDRWQTAERMMLGVVVHANRADALAQECAAKDERIREMEEPRSLRTWHEDRGFVLWWTRPVSEPPYVGNPLCSDWPGYHLWWTPLPSIPPKLAHRAARLIQPAAEAQDHATSGEAGHQQRDLTATEACKSLRPYFEGATIEQPEAPTPGGSDA